MNLLVIGIGNPSRGDDAIGPSLIERLAGRVPAAVELMTDFQLQVEVLLDLRGRDLVVFADASIDADPPFTCTEAAPAVVPAVVSHAMAPADLLAAYVTHFGHAPPRSLVLAVRGYDFELGEGLSAGAAANLEAAQRFLEELLVTAAAGHVAAPAQAPAVG